MCLATKTNTPSISANDIDCYKILIPVGGKLITPYRDFLFPVGEVVTDEVEAPEPKSFGNVYLIEAGYFHAYDNLRSAMRKRSELMRRLFNKKTEFKVFKAILPAGTPYFQNEFGDICSKSLKIVEECCD